MSERVDPPFEGWSQTVPNERNARLILRLDPLIRSVSVTLREQPPLELVKSGRSP